MRVLRRRLVFGSLVAAAFVVLALASAGPLVRARLDRVAARYALNVRVGAVHFGWFALYLSDLTVRPVDWDGLTVHVPRARVGLTTFLGLQRLEVDDPMAELHGSSSEVIEGARRWRASIPGDSSKRSERSAAPVTVLNAGFSWRGAAEDVAELGGVRFERRGAVVKCRVQTGRIRLGGNSAELSGLDVELGSGLVLSRVHASTLGVSYARPEVGLASPEADELTPAPTRAEDAGKPLFGMPDLRRVRLAMRLLADQLSQRMPVGSVVSVDALTLQAGASPGGLTVGPGSFALSRTPPAFDVRFTAGSAQERAQFSLQGVLPTGDDDVTLLAQGGPLSLSALGVRDGEWGLTDVDRATLAGQLHLALSADHGSLTFDGEGAVRGIALNLTRLAPEVVRGLDMGVRARGVADSDGNLRLDDFGATLGQIRLIGSGSIEQARDRVTGSLHAEVPVVSCQSILESLPTSLLPVLQGAHVAGNFGGHGLLSFDTRSLDDLRLDYDLQDDCRATAVPESLARERFRGPFAHHIYLPDGTISEVLTGPGTEGWTPLEGISPYMEVAVTTTEDGAFRKHRGFNRSAIRASLVANLKARRFVRGASTITMQLAKNIFLSRDKTISRKLEELALTEYLEQAFNKDELLELYFNIIEFGPSTYGIGPAADYYFGRTAGELNLAECLFLSSLLPSPLRYGKMRDGDQAPESWMKMLHATMETAHKRGLITDAELAEGLTETVVFYHGGPRPPSRPPVRVRGHLEAGDDEGGADDQQAPPLTP
jgi:hypothetical protein